MKELYERAGRSVTESKSGIEEIRFLINIAKVAGLGITLVVLKTLIAEPETDRLVGTAASGVVTAGLFLTSRLIQPNTPMENHVTSEVIPQSDLQ
jgi:hypothetical protein